MKITVTIIIFISLAVAYILCGCVVLMIYKTYDVCKNDDSSRWKWESGDEGIIIFFPLVIILAVIGIILPFIFRKLLMLPYKLWIALVEAIRAHKKLRKERSN